MQLVAGGGGKGGPPIQPDAAQHGPAGPSSSPMATPQPAEGDKQGALVTLNIARDLLEHTIPGLGSETEEGKVVLQCLQSLAKKFGDTKAKSEELMPADLMQLFHSMPQLGGMSPEGKAMQQPPQPGMPH